MSEPGPVHAALQGIVVDGDCLVFGGRRVTELAEQVGRTPFYAYDRAAMTARVEWLRAHLPREIHLHYAMKANPMPAVVRHFLGLVDGLDVASAGELAVALAAGASPEVVSFAGPGKSSEDLAAALDAGVIVNLESPAEMRRLGRLAAATGRRARVAIRVNPDFELKTSGMKMAGGPKQFGVDAEQVPGLLAELATLELDFVGFHIFSGSQNLSPAAIIEAQTQTLDLAKRLATAAPAPVRLLNIGGGFGIPYFPADKPLDLAQIGRHLHALQAETKQALPTASLVIELGRYLVGEAGIYVCRVVDRKVSRGQVFLVTDGGLHHHLAASGNFGQVLRKNYPVAIGNRVREGERETVSVVGPLCTPLDLLADRVALPRADEGDLVVVFQSGAYGRSASPLGFLSHPPPAEILV
jgi:diaminopimelate decarboxylase